MTPALRLTPMGLRAFGRRIPCTIGRGGLSGDKREGDGATPRGTHRIVAMFHRAERMRAPVAWSRAIGPADLWSDDMRDPAYNTLVRAPHSFSHERLRRGDRLYDLVMVLDWNWPHARPGRGSAIFLHRWRRAGAPTEGCIAVAPEDLVWIARRIRPGQRLRVP